MISTTIQRYILLVITSLCVLGCVYIAIIIYNNFYLPIFDEVSTINNQVVEPFPTPAVTAVLKALDDRQQDTVDLTTVHNPFVSADKLTNEAIPGNELEPTLQ